MEKIPTTNLSKSTLNNNRYIQLQMLQNIQNLKQKAQKKPYIIPQLMKKKDLTIKNNPFLDYSPLKPHKNNIIQNDQLKSSFLDFLNGKINEEELMYIRNFPNLYDGLPEPK